MKNILFIGIMLLSFLSYGQRHDKGHIDGPMTTAEINAIATPELGQIIYDSDTLTNKQWNGSAWIEVAGGGGGTTYTAGNGLTLNGSEFEVDNPFTTTNESNLNTAFGWGDWSTGVDQTFVEGLGFSTTETDPIYSAWDKDYDDLTNKPTLFTWDYDAADLTGTIDDARLSSAVTTSLGLADSALQSEVDGSITNEIQDASQVDLSTAIFTILKGLATTAIPSFLSLKSFKSIYV